MVRDACCARVSQPLVVDDVDCGICCDREREGRGLFVVLPVTTNGGKLRFAL